MVVTLEQLRIISNEGGIEAGASQQLGEKYL
jgi:hypothetical protein